MVLLALFVYTDLTLPSVNQNSDYLMTFYTAGHLASRGEFQNLYPPTGANTFIDTAFDKAAHSVLPLLPQRATAEYMYMPAVATFFVPFSLCPPSYSLLAWQICSLTSLVVCVVLFSSKFLKHINGLNDVAFWSALSLIPFAISVWIGQVSVVFGVLPLMVGLYFAIKSRPVLAGIFWSLTVIKPQFFVPALMMAVGLALTRNYKPLIGITCGASLLLGLNAVIFSPALFSQWISTVKLADAVYSDLKSGVAQHVTTSFPRTIILLTPVSMHTVIKPVVYAIAAGLGLLGLMHVVKLLRSKLSSEVAIGLSMIICAFATPMVVPHVFFYDYSIFIAAGFVAYAIKWPEEFTWRIRSLVWLTWIVINIYGIVVLTCAKFAIPLVLVLIMMELYRRTIFIARDMVKITPANAGEVPQSSPA